MRLPRREIALVAVICLVLAATFAALSYSAALQKSATLDEPLHTAGAFADARLGDHRIDLENPPLWKYWMMLPVPRSALRWDEQGDEWRSAAGAGEAQVWATRTLYQTPGNNGIVVINTARAMLLLLALATLILTALWAHRLGGAVAAVAAAALFAFDPTILAHASIVKNDVALALCMLILIRSLASACERLTIASIAGIALACAAAMNIKLSGLLLPVIAAIVLLIRALRANPWNWRECSIASRRARIALVAGVVLATALSCFIITWAAYSFRFRASPDPQVSIDLQPTLARIAENDLTRVLGRTPIADEIASWQPAFQVRTALAIQHHQLLPEAWIAGFIRFKSVSEIHQNYLLGEVRDSGWWYYFPLAIVVKLPLATLAAGALVAVILLIPRWRRALALNSRQRTAIFCCAAASAIYLLAGMAQNIDHGVRHLLPLFPLAYIVISIVTARAWVLRPRTVRIITAALAITLLAESLAAWPNYIDFFNLAAGGSRGGLRLLGDSNLDWGQDLPLLAKWQAAHPSERLYLCYYGAADPAAYGIRYVNLASGFFLGPPAEPITAPGVIAISATRLQGLYMSPELRQSYGSLRAQTPREVLGGSIYLFDYPSKEGK